MNYLQALAELYRDGTLPRGVIFHPDLMEQIQRDRQSIGKSGHRLWIEPQNAPQEIIKDLENGKRLIRYSASILYAFEKEGRFHPDPSAAPFEDKRSAIEGGEFSFIVDAAGIVIGWGDNLTGNWYGERLSGSKSSQKVIWVLIGTILLAALILRLVR